MNADLDIIDAYYGWFKTNHEDYSDEDVIYATNKDDVKEFVQYVQDILDEEFFDKRR